jgi:hypothetical protein
MPFDGETKLKKTATRGVVALFNAVRKQQKSAPEKGKFFVPLLRHFSGVRFVHSTFNRVGQVTRTLKREASFLTNSKPQQLLLLPRARYRGFKGESFLYNFSELFTTKNPTFFYPGRRASWLGCIA